MKTKKLVSLLVLLVSIVIFTGVVGCARGYDDKNMGISFMLDDFWTGVSNSESYLFKNTASNSETIMISCTDPESPVSVDMVSDEDFLSVMDSLYSLDVLKENIEKYNPGASVNVIQNYQTNSREIINGQTYFRFEKIVTFKAPGYSDRIAFYISYVTIANGRFYEFHYERPSDVNNYSMFVDFVYSVSFENGKIGITVNGETIIPDSDPVIFGGRTLVPIRAVAEKLGYSVKWDGEKQLVTLTSADGATVIHFSIGLYEGLKNYTDPIPLEVAPVIIGSRTYLPLRAVAEAVNAKVDWDGDTRTVIIKY